MAKKGSKEDIFQKFQPVKFRSLLARLTFSTGPVRYRFQPWIEQILLVRFGSLVQQGTVPRRAKCNRRRYRSFANIINFSVTYACVRDSERLLNPI
jgi:hypothetical protein